MQRFPLLSKFVAVGLLALLLGIPIALIHSTLSERESRKAQVEHEVATSSFGPQKIIAPILVLPYRVRVTREQWDEKSKTHRIRQIWEDQSLHFFPEEAKASAQLHTEQRYRGLYKVLHYGAGIEFSGRFQIPKGFGIHLAPENVQWGDPILSVGVSDTRGIKSLALDWNGQALAFLPGAHLGYWPQGVHAPLPTLDPEVATSLAFSVHLDLKGTSRLEWVPLGNQVEIRMRSAWPHPSFQGRFLPDERQVSAAGFDARWRLTHFATNAREKLEGCLRESTHCGAFTENALVVSLIEPVDIYRQVDRALKYPLLFIGLTFAAFMLVELFKRVSIHPVQYGLVGAALALFFLILLTLSEHLAFAWAYLCATGACVALIAFYVSHVLRSPVRGLAFGIGLAALFGALYLVLLSEDYSLVIGTGMLFCALAAIMVATRRVDWYDLSAHLAQGATPASPPPPRL